MLSDPTHCEQKVPCQSGPGFEQCRRRWADAVVVTDPATNGHRLRRFCREHAREAGRNQGYGMLLVRRPEPHYTYRFRLTLGVVIGAARSEAEARQMLVRLLRPLAGCAQFLEDDGASIALDGEPELANGSLLAAWEHGVSDQEGSIDDS